jgi:hypothetical protein
MCWAAGWRRCVEKQRPHDQEPTSRDNAAQFRHSLAPDCNLGSAHTSGPMGPRQDTKRTVGRTAVDYCGASESRKHSQQLTTRELTAQPRSRYDKP